MWFYRPVVRWKRGERGALSELSLPARRLITPIIEPVLSCYSKAGVRKGTSAEINALIAQQLRDTNWSGVSYLDARSLPYWVDMREPRCATVDICEAGRDLGLQIIPVLGRHGTRTIEEVAASNACRAYGLALRLTLVDLVAPTIAEEIQRIVTIVGVAPRRIDLILDLGEWYHAHPPISYLMRRIGGDVSWRSVTMLCGSFPKDLSDFPQGMHTLPRKEWHSWLDQVVAHGLDVSYGDYTTQHAIFTEPPEAPNPSVSVRVATPSDWIIARGRAVKDGGSEQWYGHATMLSLRPDMPGPDFCVGSRYVHEHCSEDLSTGNFTTWLQATVNIHMEVVAVGIASLGVRMGTGTPSILPPGTPLPWAAKPKT